MGTELEEIEVIDIISPGGGKQYFYAKDDVDKRIAELEAAAADLADVAKTLWANGVLKDWAAAVVLVNKYSTKNRP